MALGILEGTLLDLTDRLEGTRMTAFGRLGLLRAIDELAYVTEELGCTRQKIGEARRGYRRLRSSMRWPKGGKKN
jgi:hypothetical protein